MELNETHRTAADHNSEAGLLVAAAPGGIVPAVGTGFVGLAPAASAPAEIAAAGLVPVAFALVAVVPAARRTNWVVAAILAAAIVVAPNSEARVAAVSQPVDCSRRERLVEIGMSDHAGNSAIEPRYYRRGSVSNARSAVRDCCCPESPHE